MTLKEAQKLNHCGPCALSYALYMLLGRDVDQSNVVEAVYPMTGYMRVALDGMDPEELKKAAKSFGVVGRDLTSDEKYFEEDFYRPLHAEVAAGNPALLCVNLAGGGETHWVCLAGVSGSGFIVCDPFSDKVFSVMSRGDLEDELLVADDEDEEDEYFATVFSRKDGKPAAFKLSRKFMTLVEDDSYDDVGSMRGDLEGIAEELGSGKIPLSEHLQRIRPTVLSALDHMDWEETELDRYETRGFYDDYIIVAESAGFAVPHRIDDAVLASEMAVILATCAWCGKL